MRIKVPWSEIATLAALYIAAARWSHAGSTRPGGSFALLFALVLAWIPRGPTRREGVTAQGESVFVACAAAAVGLSTFFAGSDLSRVLGFVRALAFGLAAAAALFAAIRMGRTDRPGALSILTSLAIGAAVGYSSSPHSLAQIWTGLAPAALFPLLAFVFAARFELTPVPRVRATFVMPGMTAGAAAGLVAVSSLARHAHPDAALALLGLALVVAGAGLVVGVSGRGLAWRARVAQGIAALLAGGFAAAIAAALADDVALAAAGGVLGGTAIAIAAGAGLLRADRGRLLVACKTAHERATGAEQLGDLATAVLEPLRAAMRDLKATAEMWVLPFDARFALDVSGAALKSKLSPAVERAVLAWLRTRPNEVVFADVLRPLEVRRAEVRPVLAALAERDTFAVVPLTEGTELIGALLIPRGRREALPTLEEQDGLEDLGRKVASALGMVMALERARERANEAVARAQDAESRADAAERARERALARIRGVRTVRAVGSLEDTWIGYGEAMRRFETQLRAIATNDAPVAFIAEPGLSIAAVAHMLHTTSLRASEACVIVDAGQVHPRDALATLVGTMGAADDEGASVPASPLAGWLEVVEGGTLVIVDAPALGADAHVALVDAMKTGTARRLGGGVPYPVGARIVLTARDTLVHTGLPAELCERFADTTLRIPALRERGEDIETLVLFAIDRGCRLHGRPAIGIRRDTLEALRSYAWPENERELFEALEHAVRVARGAQITIADLPEALRGAPVPPGDGREADGESYDAMERRILQAALDRASGNKSEAARALGLKRTTFLDKLRKYGLRA